jgi:predicted hydrocarbon binding protein
MNKDNLNKETIFFNHLNNLLLGISHLAEEAPMGGEDYLDVACEYYIQRMFKYYGGDNYKPISNGILDLCDAWIDVMHRSRFLDKKDYRLNSNGEQLEIKVNKQNCTYIEYCTAAKEENLPMVCMRMLSCKWIANKFSGRPHLLQKEKFSDGDLCQGTILPGEKPSEILSKDGDKISVAGERAIVLSTKTLGILFKTIYDYAPHLLDQVLYESTYYVSLQEYEKISQRKNTREALDYVLNTLTRLGNTRLQMIEFDEINKRAVIRGNGSFTAEVFKDNNMFNSPKTSCAGTKGRLAAYFTRAWAEEVVCEEVKCEAFGDDYCEFILLPKKL